MDEEEKLPKRQLILVGIAVLLTGILLIVKPSHSVFQVNKTINIMDAKVGNFKREASGWVKSGTVGGGDAVTVDLVTGMIPVIWGEDVDTNWYNYNSFKWANAVLVSDANRTYYQNAEPGTVIYEDDILAYFVYIPRYRYQLWNANNGVSSVQTINIEFENKATTPVCGGNTCTTNRIYSTGTNGQMLTHPAFTFGTTELNGIWVGKFETSGYTTDVTTATCMSAPSASTCNNTNMIPVIKPNVSALRYQTFTNEYGTAIKFKSNVMYGINNSTIDSHMMKNMEWGAVAYLSQSIYGKKGNQGTEIWINNYNVGSGSYYNTLTGCSAASVSASSSTSCTYPYPNSSGVEASTTGTLYGIYDMSGGALEYVMGNMAASGQTPPANINPLSSGFTSPYPNNKYYDSYLYGTTNNDATAFARGYLGDGTKETLTCLNSTNCAWYSDISAFVYSSFAWFCRGGDWDDALGAGVGFFYFSTGLLSLNVGFRVTLVVE